MTTYIFSPPTVEEGPSGAHRLFEFFRLNRGLTVLKSSSQYAVTRYPTEDVLALCDAYYIGGHKYPVSEAVKAELIAGGIGVTEANFTAE